MPKKKKIIIWFKDLGIKDVALVGGKNAALGEMFGKLRKIGIAVPDGFALTAAAYNLFLEKSGLDKKIEEILKGLNTKNIKNLLSRGRAMRRAILAADLPKEIQSEHVLNNAGFELLFDAVKGRFVIEKKDEFQGRESKTYQIELRDIWYISPKQTQYVRTQTEELNKHFQESNYAEFSTGITAEVMRLLSEIDVLQAEVADAPAIQDRIRAYTLNSQKMNVTQSKVKELQDLLMDLPITAKPKPVMETSPEGVREIQKIKDVSKILSMGIKPDLSTTWWIILGIIGFLMIFATIFYVVWIRQLKKNIYKGKPEPSE